MTTGKPRHPSVRSWGETKLALSPDSDKQDVSAHKRARSDVNGLSVPHITGEDHVVRELVSHSAVTSTETAHTAYATRTHAPTIIRLPPRRMITRALLKGTSPALREYAASQCVDVPPQHVQQSDEMDETDCSSHAHSARVVNVHPSLSSSSGGDRGSSDMRDARRASINASVLLRSRNASMPMSLSMPTHTDASANTGSTKRSTTLSSVGSHTLRSHGRSCDHNNSSCCNSKSSIPGADDWASDVHSEPSAPALADNAVAPQVPGVANTFVIGGVLRCVCNAFLVNPQEMLLECCVCRNWCHPACVGVDHAEMRIFLRRRNYVCLHCYSAQHRHSPDEPSSAVSRGGYDMKRDGEVSYTMFMPSSPLDSTRVGPISHASIAAPQNQDGEHDEETRNARSSLHGSSQTCFSHSRQPPTPRQTPMKLREVPDSVVADPTLASQITHALQSLYHVAHCMGYDVLDLPINNKSHNVIAHDHNHTCCEKFSGNDMSHCGSDNSNSIYTYSNSKQEAGPTGLDEAEVSQCMDCCASAVREATFSASYPVYCLKEVQAQHHRYVQGTLLRHRRTNTICTMILSNGMDVYGNLRPTLAQLKSAVHRGVIRPCDVTAMMQDYLRVRDTADFVHITLSATHVNFQRRGLARLAMALELLKWARRGRTRAYLNMAIEKRLVADDTRVEYVSSAASRRLYHSFGFADVYPRYDPLTGAERWTAKETDMGRVMANLNMVESVLQVAQAVLSKHHDNEQEQQKQQSHKRSLDLADASMVANDAIREQFSAPSRLDSVQKEGVRGATGIGTATTKRALRLTTANGSRMSEPPPFKETKSEASSVKVVQRSKMKLSLHLNDLSS